MATPSLAEDQLIELLLQLKKTTPDAARQILNSQPQIAYALISLMVKLDAVDIHVLQKTLSDFSNANPAPPPQAQQPAAPPQTQVPSAAPTPVAPAPSAPTPTQQPYYQHQQPGYHRDTPPVGGTNGYREDMYRGAPYGVPPAAAPAPNHQAYNYAQHQPQQPPAPPQIPSHVYEALAAFPEDQKAMLLRVVQMTPEQINALSPQDRANIAQLRATLGLAT